MSWQLEFKDALRSHEDIKNFFQYDFPDIYYPLFIPKILAKKIMNLGPQSALWKQFLPHADEVNNRLGLYDPIGDKVYSLGNQLIHRYHNRVLFTPTTICPVLCRYCFRKNELADKDELFNQNYSEAKKYLKDHLEIDEIIFTGGDPLILSNEKLAGFIQDFKEIKNIKYLRFHTRTPVILPSRIDDGFLAIMSSAKELFKRSMLMIHINHVEELDHDVIEALKRLTDEGIEVFSQTVLLKGINDKTETLVDLFRSLADLKIKPYYLHHPDQALGAMHFSISLEAGRRIVHPLHNLLPGWAIPQYVIDIPGGEGKIPALNPESFSFGGSLLNRHGNEINL